MGMADIYSILMNLLNLIPEEPMRSPRWEEYHRAWIMKVLLILLRRVSPGIRTIYSVTGCIWIRICSNQPDYLYPSTERHFHRLLSL